jgi:hypothetical protein
VELRLSSGHEWAPPTAFERAVAGTTFLGGISDGMDHVLDA